MGFPSPAHDYVEQRINLNTVCGLTPTAGVIDTATGYAIIETQPVRIEQGDTLLIGGSVGFQFVRLHGQAFVTPDGDVYEGEGMEGIQVIGLVTFFVNRADEDGCPVM
ncbi:hypothetical protein KXR87_08580 [Yokenella regensburgei]|uniref:hypothetical protein n=1 Tax=Yokenella regensburgei TaxID=158877 RepID=UPI003F16CE87